MKRRSRNSASLKRALGWWKSVWGLFWTHLGAWHRRFSRLPRGPSPVTV